jgi:hypothetical protein
MNHSYPIPTKFSVRRSAPLHRDRVALKQTQVMQRQKTRPPNADVLRSISFAPGFLWNSKITTEHIWTPDRSIQCGESIAIWLIRLIRNHFTHWSNSIKLNQTHWLIDSFDLIWSHLISFDLIWSHLNSFTRHRRIVASSGSSDAVRTMTWRSLKVSTFLRFKRRIRWQLDSNIQNGRKDQMEILQDYFTEAGGFLGLFEVLVCHCCFVEARTWSFGRPPCYRDQGSKHTHQRSTQQCMPCGWQAEISQSHAVTFITLVTDGELYVIVIVCDYMINQYKLS